MTAKVTFKMLASVEFLLTQVTFHLAERNLVDNCLRASDPSGAFSHSIYSVFAGVGRD
jgi:hypothetical protein